MSDNLASVRVSPVYIEDQSSFPPNRVRPWNVTFPWREELGPGDSDIVSFECNMHYHEYPDFGIPTALIRANRQIHAEAEPVLYENCNFYLGECLRTAVIFLKSISEIARLSIRSIRMVLLHRHKWPDNEVEMFDNVRGWTLACEYIAANLRLHHFYFDALVTAVAKDFKAETGSSNDANTGSSQYKSIYLWNSL